MVRDPVCGRFIAREEAVASAERGREAFYFCSAPCRDAFAAEPDRWLARSIALPPAELR